jgi:superfamily I DNA and RNA helicase
MANLVEEFFAQSFDLLPAVSSFVEAGQRSYARHSGLVVEILESLSMDPFRLRVRGTAGCGKSLMAQRLFRRAVRQGKRPLLVCFNRPLAERMKSLLDGGYVDTWHGLCTKFLESIGQKPDFTQANADPSFWKQVLDDVLAAEISSEWRFDALIVDEGQDFEADWFEILKTFLTDEASITWLEDPAQNLYSRPALGLPGFVALDIKANYRTPQRIARFIEDTLAPNIRWPNDLPGLGVQVHEYETPADQLKLAGKIVQDLMRLGFRHEDIAIISLRGYKNSVFFEADKVGGLAVRRFSGDYLPDGTQVMTDGQLLYDSIYRFKGQEAPAIILTDVDLGGGNPERARAALFCGMTRPTVRLEILVAADNPENSFLLTGNR